MLVIGSGVFAAAIAQVIDNSYLPEVAEDWDLRVGRGKGIFTFERFQELRVPEFESGHLLISLKTMGRKTARKRLQRRVESHQLGVATLQCS
jgi:hypothetical protein